MPPAAKGLFVVILRGQMRYCVGQFFSEFGAVGRRRRNARLKSPPRPESLLEGLMRIQDKIKGHKIARARGAAIGVKVDDELPVPHHSGYVAAPADNEPLFDHQKITG